MSQWLTAKELAGLTGMPATHSAVVRRAKRDDWESRQRSGRGGGREYSLESLPQETQAALLARRDDLHSIADAEDDRAPRASFEYDPEGLWSWAMSRPLSMRAE
ncbi:hypothetical protein HN240_19440, partial [Acinetobacter baumannii]|uniref:DNA-binding protein n=1 Tax=Acinetobacter baumannii TaxID=470 RepID=UPI0018E0BF2A